MRIAIVVAAALATPACLGRASTGTAVSAFEVRTGVASSAWASFGEREREQLRAGKVRAGMPEGALYIARGRPIFWWNVEVGGERCRVMLYGKGRSPGKANAAYYTCDGEIRRRVALSPQLPCWRLSAVGKRIVRDLDYFERLGLDRQWSIVAGLLRRGQPKRDVVIAFGDPYNTGTEVREDGTRAGTSVYLDHGGEAYGLYVTFVDERVAGWRVPAERRLTPEAQQRRLEATEKRLMSQLKQMEENADRRHRESVSLLNDVLSNQDDMMAELGDIGDSIRDGDGGSRGLDIDLGDIEELAEGDTDDTSDARNTRDTRDTRDGAQTNRPARRQPSSRRNNSRRRDNSGDRGSKIIGRAGSCNYEGYPPAGKTCTGRVACPEGKGQCASKSVLTAKCGTDHSCYPLSDTILRDGVRRFSGVCVPNKVIRKDRACRLKRPIDVRKKRKR